MTDHERLKDEIRSEPGYRAHFSRDYIAEKRRELVDLAGTFFLLVFICLICTVVAYHLPPKGLPFLD